MSAPWIIESVDVFTNNEFCLAPCVPRFSHINSALMVLKEVSMASVKLLHPKRHYANGWRMPESGRPVKNDDLASINPATVGIVLVN